MKKSLSGCGFLAFAFLLIPLTNPGRTADILNTVLSPHAQDLVVLKGDQLVPFQADPFLKAPYTVLYFGAGWCPDCRRFSPSLVSAYAKQDPQSPRFEVLLLSVDKNAEGMQKYMQSEKMPWPALAFDKLAGAAGLKKFYSGHGYPCLTVIDPQGKILLQSKTDQDAKEILNRLITLVQSSGPAAAKASATSKPAPSNRTAQWARSTDAAGVGYGIFHFDLRRFRPPTDTWMALSRLRGLMLHAKMDLQEAFSK